MEIRYTRLATRTLARIPQNVAFRIQAKIRQLAEDPAVLANNVTELRGHPGVYRLRVGDWRVIYTQDGRVLLVQRVAPRGSAYT